MPRARAARRWPTSDAVGGRFRLTDRDAEEWFTVIGVALGVAGAFGVTRVIASLLYNVTRATRSASSASPCF